MPYIGVPRESVVQRRELIRRHEVHMRPDAYRQPHTLPQGFFAFQAHGQGGGVRAGG